jgi:adenine-specific DNA-methyltransferase|nr:MAG TPA: adenine-specific methyltransferase [Caudoviricetes sp.]
MYEFNWEGKELAYKLAQTPSIGTLIPDKESSKNWDDTENLYIEGDNLEVLKLLQKSYFGKVKMIYIDPPYNTGKDFVYHDNFRDNIANYKEITNQTTRANPETNGRYHTDWLNMMYPRLKLARNLLREDGVIFISIDDNENSNLRKICDEVFGESNYVQEIIWQKKFSPQNDAKYFSLNHENIYCYAKSKDLFSRNLLPMTDEQKSRYKNLDNDSRGPWTSGDISVSRVTEKDIYGIKTPSGREIYPPNGRSWRVSEEKLNDLIKDNRIWFGENGDNVPRIKRFLSEVQNGIVPISLWYHEEVGHTQSAAQNLKKLFNDKALFDYPKPVELIKKELLLATDKNDIVLDFFSGASTTAHAVMQLNMEDIGKRKFIMVQLPELTYEKSDAYKSGYKNICEIGKERIRRAGDKIVSENKDKEGIENLDIGFKVFKLDCNKGDSKMYNEKLMNSITIEILTDKKPKELKGKKKIATINKDIDYKVQVFIDDDYNLYYQDNHAFASCESKIVHNKVETSWNSCKCWFKIIGLYECKNAHIVDILRDLDSYSEHLYPKNNVADNMALSRLYEHMVKVYLNFIS